MLDPDNPAGRIFTRYHDIPLSVNVYDLATAPNSTDPHGVLILDNRA